MPLKTFAGTIGLALVEPGLHSIVPPRRTGGNLDIRDLSTGAVQWVRATIGISPDLMAAAREAVSRMIDLLVRDHDMVAVDAYMLCSVCGDLRISEIVDLPDWAVSFEAGVAMAARLRNDRLVGSVAARGDRMVRFIVGMLAMISALATPALAADGDRRTFVIKQFRLENGTVLPEARVMYATYGTLNAAHDNAVLLPSHYMADSHGYEWLIGPDKALDPRKYFLIATELFGNGKSSSPSNTPAPLDGPRFPVTSIRDNVSAVHRLLDEALGVHHLRAIVGFSMGGEQAFQWAVSHPGFADRIVITSATAKTWPHGIVRLESQIMAIQNDPAFAGGDYRTPPKAGLQTFGAIWAGWLFSQGWWREELWRAGSPPGTTFRTVFEGLYKDFVPGGDANDLILQMRTWEGHDIGTTPGMGGDVKRALASITVPVLYMPSATDLYFPVDDARYEAGFMPHVTLLPIPSLWGHTAGAASNPADATFLNDHIGAFMRAGEPTR